MVNFQEDIAIRIMQKYERRITEFVHNIYLTAFEKYGWRGDYNGLEEDDLEFFSSSVTYLAVGAATNNIYGTVKAIEKNPDKLLPVERDFGIRSQNLLQNFNLPDGKIIEVARFATDRLLCHEYNFEHKDVTLLLMKKFCADSRKKNIAYWLASIDEGVCQWLIRIGFPFQAVGPSKLYIGSPTVPVFLDCAKLPEL